MKVSPQQSRGVKCLSCLFTVNDGFDSSPKEQWEMGSEGHALGVDGEGGGGCRRFVMMRSVLPIEWEFSCRCVYTCFWRQLKAYGQPSQTPPPIIAPSHLSTQHKPSGSCWWLPQYHATVALLPIYHHARPGSNLPSFSRYI